MGVELSNIAEGLELKIREYLHDHPYSSIYSIMEFTNKPRTTIWDELVKMQKQGKVIRHYSGNLVSYTETVVIKSPREYKEKNPLSMHVSEQIEPATARCPYCGTAMRYNQKWKHYTCRNLMCNRIVPLSHLTTMQPVAKKGK